MYNRSVNVVLLSWVSVIWTTKKCCESVEPESVVFRSDPEKKFNTNCFVSQTYFVASELRPTVVFTFVFK